LENKAFDTNDVMIWRKDGHYS